MVRCALNVKCGEWDDMSFLSDMKQELKLESLPYPMHRLDKASRQILPPWTCLTDMAMIAHHGRVDIRVESTNGTRYLSAISKPQGYQEVSCCGTRWKQDFSQAVGNHTDKLVHRLRGTGKLVATREHRREKSHV